MKLLQVSNGRSRVGFDVDAVTALLQFERQQPASFPDVSLSPLRLSELKYVPAIHVS